MSMDNPHSTFTLWETKAMARLGIRDRDLMRELRGRVLQEDVDWAVIKNRVWLTAAALEKIEKELQTASVACVAKNGHAHEPIRDPRRLLPERAASALPSVFQVVKAAPFNPHVLVCVPEGYSREDMNARVLVKVKDNRNFLPQSKTGTILAERGPSGTWEFAGRPSADGKNNHSARCPRFRGAW